MEVTANWIFGILFSAAMGFMGWSVKELYSQLKNGKKETEKFITALEVKLKEDSSKLENKIEKLETTVTEKYALKEDFHREINKVDAKLDYIRKDVTEISKNVSSLIAITEKRLS